MVSPRSEDAAVSDAAQSPSEDRRTRLLAAAAVTLGQLSDVLTPLGELFAARGHELYLVGGSVRDAVLGRLGTDLDFTTDARPEVVQEIIRGWADHLWDTGGLAFGTVSAAKGDQQLEITTFRSDSYDRVSRNPQVTFGDSLEGDLIRRDFTVNAMAVRIGAEGQLEFVDPLGGMDALLEGMLDTPAAPEDSFNDDPLRMLRAARFVAQLGFALHPRVRAAITAMAGELERITAERVRAELDKLIAAQHPIDGINIMCETGLAQLVLPEVPAMKLEIDEHHQHKDVYWHSLTVLEQAIDQEEGDPDLVLRWAALLHDIGKPDTKRNEPGGGVSFHHHEVVGAKMVRRRMKALKYPKQFTEDVSRLVFLHLRFHGYGKGQWTDSAVRRYVTDAGELLPRLHKLVRADCTTRNKRRAAALRATYDELEQRIALLQQQEDLERVRPDLDGNAIMELLGLPPGPAVGKAWKFLKELRLDRGPLSRDEAEAALLEWWKSQG
ncbi:CCA tRNA nucleotidyltransferase [Nocardia sp. NPDC052566]|uniref:CCA tRNA nucleotidyltransferase n=1 Tax=Nocardia sp. NPDC052566 TaxID=3364330 RepID=UPI0037C9D50D